MIPILISPYEDETLSSWQHRLSVANGFDDIRRFANSFVLDEAPRSHGNRRADALESFHTFYQNLDIENTASDIFLSLTCYGGLAPFLSKFQQMQYVNAACRNKTLGSYPHILTSDVYFCPACWSDAPVYYRRHQMPGVCVCNKHHCLLHYYNSKHQETVCTPNASQAIMEKYATFAADLLRLQPDADIQATKSVIFQVIKERGYYTPADNYQRLSHDMADYAGFYAKSIGYFLSDTLLGRSYIPIMSTMALLCFLFPSAEKFVELLAPSNDESFALRLAEDKYDLCSPMRYNLIELRHKACGTHHLTTAYAFGHGWSCPACDSGKSDSEIFAKLVKYTGGGEYKLLSPYTGMSRPVEIQHLSCGTTSTYLPVHFLEWRRCPTCQWMQDKNTHHVKLYHWLLAHYSPSNVIFSEDIDLPVSDYGVKKSTFKRLIHHGILSRLASGIYTFPGATFSTDEIITQRYISQNGDTRGFFFGKSFAYQIGLLKNPPAIPYITTVKESLPHGRKVSIMHTTVYLRGSKIQITEENVLILQLLSLLPNLIQYSDYSKSETYQKLAHHVLRSGIDLSDCKQYYHEYPNWVPSCVDEIERIITHEKSPE